MLKTLFDKAKNGAAGDWRALGDRERDRENWHQAAEAYARYLDANPKDFGIHVQRGNCLKEAGSFDEALQCYQTAKELQPNDADLHVQLGHLAKLRGRLLEAEAHYHEAIVHDPESSAMDELIALRNMNVTPGVASEERMGVQEPTAYLDVTDVLFYLRNHMNVSGIQRVVLSIFEAAQKDSSLINKRHRYCAVDQGTGVLREVPKRALDQVARLLRSPRRTREELDRVLDVCGGHRIVEPTSDDVFMIMGAFWVSPSYDDLLVRLRNNQVPIGVYVYDLIPITHRQFVDRGLAASFSRQIIKTLSLCDFATTISQYVAHELNDFMLRYLGRTIPIRAITLAQEMPKSIEGRVNRDISALVEQSSIVLCVGTIEIRKNHNYLFNIWRDLLNARGASVPTLVIVGRWGWRVDELKRALEDTDYLDGRIVILDSVSDADLSYLYQKSLFTIFPSFVEGWGLPIGESLAHGTPCIASRVSSMPEVGGDYVEYIDPFNVTEGRSVIERFLDDPVALEAWRSRISREFRPRSWADVARELGAAIDEFGKPASTKIPACTVPQLEIIPLGSRFIDFRGRRLLKAHAYPLICCSGWHELEDWGRWAAAPQAKLQFAVEGGAPNERYRVALRICLPSVESSSELSLRSGSKTTKSFIWDGSRRWYMCEAEADDTGIVEISIRGPREPLATDNRPLYFGITGLAIVADSAPAGHLNLHDVLLSFP